MPFWTCSRHGPAPATPSQPLRRQAVAIQRSRGKTASRRNAPRVFASEIARIVEFIERPELPAKIGIPHEVLVDPEATDLMGLLSTNNYPKGAWVLHQLRGIVGDSAFFKGMRTFYERYRNGIALSSDFEQVMEEASGQDLGWYFREALTLPGYPMLTVRWKYSGGRLQGEVLQVQPEAWGIRRIPGLELGTGSEIVRVDVSGATTKFDVKVKKAPAQVVIDPNVRWLVRAKAERL